MTNYMTPTAETVTVRSNAIKLHGPEGFEGMRKAGRLAAELLDALAPHVVPGVTTGALDDLIGDGDVDASHTQKIHNLPGRRWWVGEQRRQSLLRSGCE